jgi:hypothetical protein
MIYTILSLNNVKSKMIKIILYIMLIKNHIFQFFDEMDNLYLAGDCY